MRTYLSSMKTMYGNALVQNAEIYDIAASLTQDFRKIEPAAILADSRIIKVLRYAIAPSISQMKFGQFVGFNSIDKFEKSRLEQGTSKHGELETIAPQIASFVRSNIDRTRFIWTEKQLNGDQLNLAKDFAKKWTCSIASDQNAETRYRNWRKDQQEHAVAGAIIDLEYTKSSFRGVLDKHTDIAIGEFAQETRVKGRTRQKADLVARSKTSKKLVLIEAKAVGVEIDSTKRIKECCDKANDWRSSAALSDPVVVAVIGGFFTTTGIENLQASGIEVIWEHRLTDLKKVL